MAESSNGGNDDRGKPFLPPPRSDDATILTANSDDSKDVYGEVIVAC